MSKVNKYCLQFKSKQKIVQSIIEVKHEHISPKKKKKKTEKDFNSPINYLQHYILNLYQHLSHLVNYLITLKKITHVQNHP